MFLSFKLSLRRDRSLGESTPGTYKYLRSDHSGFTFLQPGTTFTYIRPQ